MRGAEQSEQIQLKRVDNIGYYQSEVIRTEREKQSGANREYQTEQNEQIREIRFGAYKVELGTRYFWGNEVVRNERYGTVDGGYT